jgi:serine/threonine protein kinase
MAGKVKQDDEAFLEYLEGSGYLDALECERLRTEFRRLKANDKKLTLEALLVRKGHFTKDRAAALHSAFESGGKRVTRNWDKPKTAPIEVDDDSELVGLNTLAPGLLTPEQKPSGKRPTAPVQKNRGRDTDRRPTARVNDDDRNRDTDVPTEPIKRNTSRRQTTPRTSRGPETGYLDDPNQTRDQWLQETLAGQMVSSDGDSDSISSMENAVPAGTIIAGGKVTIAQVRENMGLREDVRLISSKMESTVAHLQPDATTEQKRYVVIREIARGGMGKVLEVEDTELRRSVALKVLRKELLGRRDVVERFLEEAQITGQLEHPNIVPVHEMGVDGGGNLYFTMKYVEGQSLAELLLKLREGNRDSLRDYPLVKLLDIFIKICEGIGFAHNRGVIHRDLKPANIMVGKFGEVQVMDWGVAKLVDSGVRLSEEGSVVLTDRLTEGTAQTMVGSIIGTPSYMSPEQANGDLSATGPHTDIFSLGVILYEMLCLRSPWTGRTSDEVLDQVRYTEPKKPSERNPDRDIPAELERLCLRCLEKDHTKRLSSARELESNVRSYIEGRAMRAVKYSYTRLAAKWISRHRREVVGGLLALLMVVGGILGTAWYMDRQDRDRVLGLSDDGFELLEGWRTQVDAGEYDLIESRMDEARDYFQRVLAVDLEDERANQGIAKIRQITVQIRETRIAEERERAARDEVNSLLGNARALVAASDDALYLEQRLTDAFGYTQAVLAHEPGNTDALRLKADICRGLVDHAIQRYQLDVARFWVRQWQTTGLDEGQRRERLQQIARLHSD